MKSGSPLTIWCNTLFNATATARLESELARRGHRLLRSGVASALVLRPGVSDSSLLEADIAFGQPAVDDCLKASRLRWIEVSSGGYTRYDTTEFREAMLGRRTILTNASSVFADSCAQHVLAMMLSVARQLPASLAAQFGERSWDYEKCRYRCRRLTGSVVLMLGYGAIGRRLTELLAPFGCTLHALRRQSRSVEGVRISGVDTLTAVLPLADHIVNILPDNEDTRGFVNARRLSCVKPGAHFYNIGRGVTVDQRALCEALRSGRLGSAYLDVCEPEPLPPSNELWEAPNCFITPHIAGGRLDQDEALVEHFLANLEAYEQASAWSDRVL